MLKNAFLTILGFLVPIILVFTLYRATVNLGPMSFKTLAYKLSDSFVDTSNIIGELGVEFSNILEGVTEFQKGLNSSMPENEFTDFIETLVSIGYMFVHFIENFFDITYLLARLIYILLADIVEVLELLMIFIGGNTPYIVQRYF